MDLEKIDGKIILLGNSMNHCYHWIRHNIIPVVPRTTLQRLLGIKINKVYYETLDGFSPKEIDFIEKIIKRV